jgi:predicted aspartyl protease
MRGKAAAGLLAAALAPGLIGLTGCEFEPLAVPTEDPSPTGPARSRGGEISVPIDVMVNAGSTLVLVPIEINGRGPYKFILDTGAATSTVDEDLVRKLRLPATGETARVTGVTGSSVVPLVRVREWTVGGQRLRGRELTVTDLGDLRAYGLLGSDELRRFGRVAVDYRRERLVLRDT